MSSPKRHRGMLPSFREDQLLQEVEALKLELVVVNSECDELRRQLATKERTFAEQLEDLNARLRAAESDDSLLHQLQVVQNECEDLKRELVCQKSLFIEELERLDAEFGSSDGPEPVPHDAVRRELDDLKAACNELERDLDLKEAAFAADVEKLSSQLEEVTRERDQAWRQLAVLQRFGRNPLLRPQPIMTSGAPSGSRSTDATGQPAAVLDSNMMASLIPPEAAEAYTDATTAYYPPNAVELCAMEGNIPAPEGVRVVSAESCAAACSKHPKMAIQIDMLCPYEPMTAVSVPDFDVMFPMVRVGWMSPGLLELFEMPRDLERSLALRNNVVVRPSAIRAMVKGIWRAFFIERDFRSSVIRGVVYHAAAPTHFVCTHTSPCIWQAADGRLFWASLAYFDCSSSDYVDRVTRGLLLEHQALKYTPCSIIMTSAQGRIIYQNAAAVEALGVHASHMRVKDSDLLPQEATMNYIDELFHSDQALMDEMLRVTAASEVFRTRLRIRSYLLLSWLNPQEVEIWHDVQVTRARDAIDKSPIYIIAQSDVTEAVIMDKRVKELQAQQHSLLASTLPEQVIEVLLQPAGDVSARSRSTRVMDSLRSDAGAGSDRPRRGRPVPTGDPFSAESAPVPAQPDRSRHAGNVRDSIVSPHQRLSELSTYHAEVTVLFCDIQGFTQLSRFCHPSVVLLFLNELFSEFDKIVDAQGPLGVYKVDTIGDRYLVCAGLFQLDQSGRRRLGGYDPDHARKVLAFGRAILAAAARIRTPLGQPVNLRLGVHSGPCMSGVVGHKMPRFCLFGEAVNTASRMESSGRPGVIHVSSATRDLVPDEDWLPTGGVEVKGKGLVPTFLLGGTV